MCTESLHTSIRVRVHSCRRTPVVSLLSSCGQRHVRIVTTFSWVCPKMSVGLPTGNNFVSNPRRLPLTVEPHPHPPAGGTVQVNPINTHQTGVYLTREHLKLYHPPVEWPSDSSTKGPQDPSRQLTRRDVPLDSERTQTFHGPPA